MLESWSVYRPASLKQIIHRVKPVDVLTATVVQGQRAFIYLVIAGMGKAMFGVFEVQFPVRRKRQLNKSISRLAL